MSARPVQILSEKPIQERRCHFCTTQDKMNREEWCWSFRLCAAQQEAVRGEMERTKLNQASVFHLVKHNTTLFPAFYKKTHGDCGGRETHLQELQISLCYQQGAGWRAGGGGEAQAHVISPLYPKEYRLGGKRELSAACHGIVMSHSIRAPGPIQFKICQRTPAKGFGKKCFHDSEIS